MAKQSFTVGQVLTAAQLTSLQQTAMLGGAASAKTGSYTLVAADAGSAISMTSTSATTITVNTGLFAAGDTVFIQNLGSGNLTITAGTATVDTSASLVLAQYEGGTLNFTSSSSAIFLKAAGAAAATGGMTQLGSTTTLSGASTTVSFTATGYKNLYVLIQNVLVSTAANLKFVANGTSNITTIVRVASYGVDQTLDRITSGDFSTYVNVSASSGINSFVFNIYDVASANYKAFDGTNGYRGGAYAKNAEVFSGIIEDTNAISSIVISPSTGTWSGGTVKVFGVN
jgi:hypothetical protein